MSPQVVSVPSKALGVNPAHSGRAERLANARQAVERRRRESLGEAGGHPVHERSEDARHLSSTEVPLFRLADLDAASRTLRFLDEEIVSRPLLALEDPDALA